VTQGTSNIMAPGDTWQLDRAVAHLRKLVALNPSRWNGVGRMDAVMYLVGAIEKFGGMSTQAVQKIGIEVATLGMKGFDVNDSSHK
jgi:hypothetical protein